MTKAVPSCCVLLAMVLLAWSAPALFELGVRPEQLLPSGYCGTGFKAARAACALQANISLALALPCAAGLAALGATRFTRTQRLVCSAALICSATQVLVTHFGPSLIQAL